MDIDYQSYLLFFILGLLFFIFGSGAGPFFVIIGLIGMVHAMKDRTEARTQNQQN